ncbi:MAG: TRAP transporter substrate-binding protein [Burkholderiales bacterium]
MLKKLVSYLAAATAATVLAAFAPAASAQTEIKLPIKVNATTLRGEMSQAFGDELAKATGNRYKLTIYPGGQLYDGGKAAKAVQLGNVQMTNEPNSAFTAYTKNADLMELPFGFADADAFQEFLHGPRSDLVRKDLVKAGFHVLAFFDEGPFVIATKSVLVEKPADFKGQIIRTSGHPVVVDGLKGMGASTVKLPLNEVYSALQQGTITGVYTTFDAFVNEKMYEVAPNVMIIPSYGAYFWVANKAWFDAQPAADRKTMDAIADKLARKYDKDVWAVADEHIATTKKAGGKISDPAKSVAAHKAFRAALAPTYEKMREKFGKEAVDAILSSK